MESIVQDNVIFWLLWITTLVLCVHQTVMALRDDAKTLGLMPVISTMVGYFYVIQAAIVALNLSHRVNSEVLWVGQLVILLSYAGLVLGWHKGVGQLTLPKETPVPAVNNHLSLWYGGVTATLIGIAGQYYFMFYVGWDFSDTSAYVYLLFNVAYPGLGICVYLASRDPEFRKANDILLLLALGAIIMIPWVYSVRRGPIFTFFIVIIYSFYLARPHRVNRGVVIGGLISAGVIMLIFFSIRDYSRGFESTWSSNRMQMTSLTQAVVGKAYEEDDNEYLYNCCLISTCLELQRFQWGTSYISLLSHWIPRSWWPDKPALAVGWLDPVTWPELRAVTGVMPTPGSTYSGFGEAFQEFSWLSPIFWFALAWCVGKSYHYTIMHPSSPAPMLYVGVIASSHFLVAQGFAAMFVPMMCYLIVPLVIYSIAGQAKFTEAAPISKTVKIDNLTYS